MVTQQGRARWSLLAGASLILSLGILGARAAVPDSTALYETTLALIAEKYLWIEDVSASEALVGAAEAAEGAIPWLLVDVQGDEIVLRHGEAGEFARVSSAVDSVEALLPALQRLEAAIRAAPAAVPADVDLGVELLRGVSRELDRYSVLMYKGRLQSFNERIRGKLLGVGAGVGVRDGLLTVLEVFPDSPAEQGGLLTGDAILEIDGFSTTGLTVDQATGRIRGPEGSPVSLLVRRTAADGVEETLELIFSRAEVRIPNLTWARSGTGVGTMAIENFSEQTLYWMQTAMADLVRQGPLKGLVLDLRGNTGGSMIQACRSVDLFLTEGTVLRTEGRGGAEVEKLMRRYPARLDGTEPEVPVVVLVDQRSASASEILAGALLFSDRAILLGERTHGKGTVQMRHDLRPGDDETRVDMKLTVAEYRLTDARHPILPGVGLEPDLWVLPATFTRGGVSLPDRPGMARTHPLLTYVDERPGWREGGSLERDDYLQDLAERVILSVPDGDWSRRAALSALDRVLPVAAAEEEALLRETLAYRGLDWRAPAAAAPPAADPADILVRVSVIDPPLAGSSVEVRAIIDNQGDVPLYRARVHLAAEEGLPWHDVTLPVGYVSPGEQAIGSAMVALPTSNSSRVDVVHATLLVDPLPAPLLETTARLELEGVQDPPVAASARLSRGADGGQALVLSLENLGTAPLAGLRAQVLLPEDTRVELLARDLVLPDIAPGKTGQGTLGVLLPLGVPVDAALTSLELRVEAEGRGPVARLPLALDAEGVAARVEPPRLLAALPTEVPVGDLDVTLTVTDDRALSSLTAWWDREKIAWQGASGPRTRLVLPLTITDGHHTLSVKAVDDQGAVTARTFHVQGIPMPPAEADAHP